MKKGFKKGIIYFLVFAMLINAFPIYAFANLFIDEKVSKLETALDSEVEETTVIGEIEEKRTLNEKHYLMSDGTITAAVYPENVHYEQNGNLVDINNTLIKTNNGYTLKSNDLELEFFDRSNSLKKDMNNNILSISNNGYTLNWTIKDFNLEKSVIEKEKNFNIMDYLNKTEIFSNVKDSDKMELANTKAGITYKEAIKDIDIKYDVISNKVEESIIINNKEALRDSFEYNLSVSGLTIKQVSNNSLELLDKNGDTVFYIDAPYMYDSSHEYSDGIKLIPTKTEYGYSIKMELDTEWLNSYDRAYPIVVDPIIATKREVSHIKDTYIYNGDAGNTTKGTAHILRAGNTNASSSSGRPFRTLIQFTLPELKSGDQVVAAELNLFNYDFSGSTTAPTRVFQLDIHAITAAWSETAVYWSSFNTKYNSEIIDYIKYQWSSSNKLKQNAADITSIVKEWYNTGNNYGVMLKEHAEANNATQADAHFISVDTSSAYYNQRPYIVIQYRNQTGLEGYLTTHTQSVGRTTTYTNDYNGNLTLIHNDAATPGSRLPVSIYHVYNTNDVDTDIGYGYGFRLNLNQTLESYTATGTSLKYLKYIDEDGTAHYFTGSDTASWKDEDGLELTISLSGTSYIMKDKAGNTSTFIKNGTKWYLKEIKDVNNNKITINYNTSNYNQIISVVDGADDTITLSFTNNLLSSIKDSANRTTTYSYTSKNLTSIKYPDNLTTTYAYHSTNLISRITNVDNSYINYTYYSQTVAKNPARIMRVTEYGTDGSGGNSYTITYGLNTTTFKDTKGNTNTYTFNNLGQTIGISNLGKNTSVSDAYGVSYKYGTSTGSTNKLILETNLTKSTNNWVLNSSAETKLTSWATHDRYSASTFLVDSATSYIGGKSFKLTTNTKSNVTSFYYQRIAVDLTKTYTLSAYIKGNIEEKNCNTGNCGVIIGYEYKKVSGDWVTAYKYIDITNEWERYDYTYKIPADADNSFTIILGIEDAKGSVNFDNIQLEEGETANHYNLIENGNFVNGMSGWTKNGDVETADQVVSIDGVKAFKLTGNMSKAKNIYQYVNITGKKGDTFQVNYWAKNMGRPVKNQTETRIVFEFIDMNGAIVQKTEIPVFSDNKNWQYISEQIVANQDYKQIKITPTYNYNINNIYYTNIGLYKDEISSSYTYDANGNVISVSDQASQNSSFKYNKNNELNLSITPKGRKFIYEYDHEVTNRLLRGFNQTGLSYNYEYDSYGNVISNKVAESNMARGDISTTKTYYIKSISTNLYIGINGTNVELTTNPQEWFFIPSTDGTYYIVNKNERNKVMEVTGGSSANSTNIAIATLAESDKQRFKLEYNEDGTYSIKTKVSNYTSTIDISSGLFTNGRNIQQYSYSENNLAQTFQIVDKDKVGGKYIESSAEYSANGNYQTKVIDQRGKELVTNYNTNTGTISSIVDAKNNTTSYNYDIMNKVTSISSSNTTNSYTYNKDTLSKITHNGFDYEFIYDTFGNTKNIKVGNTSLIDNYYEANNGYLQYSIYGNNDRIDYTYDNFGRIKTKTNMVDTAKYTYDNRGNLASLSYNNTKTDYTYDLSGRLVKSNQNNNYKINYKYDEYNNLNNKLYSLNGNNESINYTLDLDDKLTNINYIDGDINYTYDNLDRLIKKEIVNGNNTYTILYEYYDITSTKTTTLLKSITNNGVKTEYTYDDNGNIETVKINNLLKYKYYYDTLNQLIKEEEYKTSSIVTTNYTYDFGGNLLTKGTNTYTYGNSNWKDQLTKYNNKAVTYDSIGNMKTYDGYTFNWTNGRELASITNGANNYTYSYNESGIRTSKIINGIKTNYYLEGNNIIYEERDGQVIYYIYDESGVSGLEINGVKYYFVKNIQGDIIEIVDSAFNVIGRYTYDTWGKIVSVEDVNNSNIVNINPFRYRGYYYDTETKLYYLNSRYYNPDIGRFINADCLVSTGTSLFGHNMYVYVDNNPIRGYDPDGMINILNLWSWGESIYEYIKNPSKENAAWLALDTLSVAIAVIPSKKTVKNIDNLTKPRVQQKLNEINTKKITNVSRSKNNLKPDQNAVGAHTTFRRDPVSGRIIHYETWTPNSFNPTGFDSVIRYDGLGRAHNNISTPHIHDKTVPGGVRPANTCEIPNIFKK